MADEPTLQPDPVENATPPTDPPISDPPIETTIQPTETVETETAPVETPGFNFREFAANAGFDTSKYEDDETAARDFFQRTRGLETELYQRSQPAPEPEPETPAEDEWNLDNHFGQLWGVPKYDPGWDDVLQINPQTGQIEGKPNQPFGVVQEALTGYTKYQQSRGSHMKDLFETGNPYKAMYEALKPAFEREFAKREEIHQAFTGREVESGLNNFIGNHSQWLATPEGQQFDVLATSLVENDNMPWPRAIEMASWKFPPKPNGSTAAPQSPTETPAQPTPETQPAEEASFIEDAARKAGHRPSSGAPSSNDPDSQGTVSAEDLSSLFRREYERETAGK